MTRPSPTIAVASGLLATLAFIALTLSQGGPWWAVLILATLAAPQMAYLILTASDKLRGGEDE